MNKQSKHNLEYDERKIEDKYKKREKKKKTKMKVSGGGVKKLQKIIADKAVGQ